jgi:hypothetical protein
VLTADEGEEWSEDDGEAIVACGVLRRMDEVVCGGELKGGWGVGEREESEG